MLKPLRFSHNSSSIFSGSILPYSPAELPHFRVSIPSFFRFLLLTPRSSAWSATLGCFEIQRRSVISPSLDSHISCTKMRISKRFPSRKNCRPSPSNISAQTTSPSSSSSVKPTGGLCQGGRKGGERGHCIAKCSPTWSVYLIVSSQLPKTYVGVTTNFFRRLKQHNGELKGGAKASSAGRPWSLACLIQGFKDRSEACRFESKWKSLSRKLSRKKNRECSSTSLLLQHREAALSQASAAFACNYLLIEWHLKP